MLEASLHRPSKDCLSFAEVVTVSQHLQALGQMAKRPGM